MQEKIEKEERIAQSAVEIERESLIAMVATLSAGVLFFVFYVLLSYKYKKNMESMLQPLLLVS